ncbi:winged helix DNA-binding domain-containing protein [Mycobacterium vicinigordonae]|uniref:Winged helix DNA-binding domain-containing protein n=1 Tax=Mycobacterium vicinigordonae TaxID=1719132 RepID=A0A7D6IAE6_9MYCO|nr:winged helix DNA-binding domain-containing protein [Mycobacterium vicinigordonae]QLL09736.1 winged helix DNA-binding domain-containing protein [Mycobacterium vicinigordonae]
MRRFSVVERRNRLARRHFLAARGSATRVTAGLLGLHATDPATPYLSLWARCPDFTVAGLDRLLYQRRSAVKHLAMRRTLWLVNSDDLPLVQAAASTAIADNERRRLVADLHKAGVAEDGDEWLDQAGAAVLRHLAQHGPANTPELRAALPELAGTYDPAPGKRWGGSTPVAPRVLTVLSARGEVVRGPNDGSWTSSRPRWVITRDWLSESGGQATEAAARADLVRRWLRTFGPATVADIKWWFGTTLTATRVALAAIGAVEVDVHGNPGYALAEDLATEPDVAPWAALLPALDPTVMGWLQRDWYIGDHREQIFDRNGNAGPTAWWNGRVVGGWCQETSTGQKGRVRLQLLEDPGEQGRRALQQRADELTAWLDGVRISPRFPSPLSKSDRGPSGLA